MTSACPQCPCTPHARHPPERTRHGRSSNAADEPDYQGLGELGLTVPRTQLLWELHQRGPTTQRDLAEAMAVTPRNITGLVDGLVASGFVTREPHPTDRRARLVSLTAHGARVMTEMAQGRDDFAATLFSEMSERRFEGLTKGLDALLVRLRELVTETSEEAR